jgi:electron transfer flavoprotein beta subunit
MEQRFKVAASGVAVDETGLKWDLSDFDGYAVEAALRLTEKQGVGEVVVLSVGPDVVQETLRKAMSMGAARGVQLKTDRVPFDGYAIACAIAAELSGGGYDLILFGRQALDTANGVVGVAVAELLGLPCVTAVSTLEAVNGRWRARRELEGAAEMLEFPVPAVVTVDEGDWRPRYPALKGIMAAKKKPLEVRPAQLGEARIAVRSLELPVERPPGRIIGQGAGAVPELVRLLQEEAKVL